MKSTFKKLTALLMTLILVFACVGCSSDSEKEKAGVGDSVNQSSTLTFEECNTISAGYYHTVALKQDGTVVAVGDNKYGQCNIDGWSNIVSIAAGSYHTVGLKADGTVVAVGDN